MTDNLFVPPESSKIIDPYLEEETEELDLFVPPESSKVIDPSTLEEEAEEGELFIPPESSKIIELNQEDSIPAEQEIDEEAEEDFSFFSSIDSLLEGAGEVVEGLTPYVQALDDRETLETAKTKALQGVATIPTDVQSMYADASAWVFDKFGMEEKAETARKNSDLLERMSIDISNMVEMTTLPEDEKTKNKYQEAASDFLVVAGGGLAGGIAGAVKSPKGAPFLTKLKDEVVGAFIGEAAVTSPNVEADSLSVTYFDLPEPSPTVESRLVIPAEGGVFGAVGGLAVEGVQAGTRWLRSSFKVKDKQGIEVELTEGGAVNADNVKVSDIDLAETAQAFNVDLDNIRVLAEGKELDYDSLPTNDDIMENLISREGYIREAVTNRIDSLRGLWVMSEGQARRNKKLVDYGPLDTQLKSPVSEIAGFQRGNGHLSTAYVRGAVEEKGTGYATTGVLEYVNPNTTSKLRINKDVKPLTNIYEDAINKIKAFGENEELVFFPEKPQVMIDDYFRAMDALDDYASIEYHLNDIAYQKSLVDETTEEGAELLAELNKAEKSWKTFKPRMTKEEADNVLERYKDVGPLQDALKEKNKLFKHLLKEQLKTGVISKSDYDNILRFRTNYVPFIKDPNFVETSKEFNKRYTSKKRPSISKLKGRTGQGAGEEVPVYISQTLALQQRANALQQNIFRRKLLEYYLTLPEPQFNQIFRENKTDVIEGLKALRNSDTRKLTPAQITSTEVAPADLKGQASFLIDGKQLTLTYKNPDSSYFAELHGFGRSPVDMGMARLTSKLLVDPVRASIVATPDFAIRNIERETVDYLAYKGDVNFFKKLLKGEKPDYVLGFSNLKRLVAKEYNRELYDTFSANYGLDTVVNPVNTIRNSDDVLKYAMSIHDGSMRQKAKKTISGTLAPFNSLLQRTDIMSRILTYESLIKNGYTHDQAMRQATTIGVDFTAQPLKQGGLSAIPGLVPFLTAGLGGIDRTLRLRKNPKALVSSLVLVYGFHKGLDVYNSQYVDEEGVPFKDKLNDDLKNYQMQIYLPGAKDANDYVPLSPSWVLGATSIQLDKMVNHLGQTFGNMENEVVKTVFSATNPEEEAYIKELKEKGVDETVILDAFSDWFGHMFNLPGRVPGVAQAIDVIGNEDWLGRPIVPKRLEDKPDPLQKKDTDPVVAGEFYKLINNRIADPANPDSGISPQVANYVLDSMFNGFSSTLNLLADSIYYHVNKDDLPAEKPAMEKGSIPGYKVLSGDLYSNVFTNTSKRYYNIRSRLDSVNAYLKDKENKYEKTGDEKYLIEANSFRDQYKEILLLDKTFKDADKKVSEIYSKIESVYNLDTKYTTTKEIETFGDPEKRKVITDLLNQKEKIQKGVLDKVYEIGGYEAYREAQGKSPLSKAYEMLIKNIKEEEDAPSIDAIKEEIEMLNEIEGSAGDEDLEGGVVDDVPGVFTDQEESIEPGEPVDMQVDFSFGEDYPDNIIIPTPENKPNELAKRLAEERGIEEEPYKVSMEGAKMITSHEGFVPHPYDDHEKSYNKSVLESYDDAIGYPTIGYGHLITPEEKDKYIGTTLTEEEALKLFQEDVQDKAEDVLRLVNVPLTQPQFDALTSFVYNVGAGNFKTSTLLKELNKGNYEKASNEFKKWVYSKGEELGGLVKRRNEEAELFKKGTEILENKLKEE